MEITQPAVNRLSDNSCVSTGTAPGTLPIWRDIATPAESRMRTCHQDVVLAMGPYMPEAIFSGKRESGVAALDLAKA
jgi:hypothetical protein